jgi:hypothetical protein
MAFVDDIEYYGTLAESGELTPQDAAQALVSAHPGEITPVGALSMIQNHRSARASYEHICDAAQSLFEAWSSGYSE